MRSPTTAQRSNSAAPASRFKLADLDTACCNWRSRSIIDHRRVSKGTLCRTAFLPSVTNPCSSLSKTDRAPCTSLSWTFSRISHSRRCMRASCHLHSCQALVHGGLMGDRHLTCRACRVIERTKRLSRTDSTHKMSCPLCPCPPYHRCMHAERRCTPKTALKCNQVELKEQAGDSYALSLIHI